MQAWSFVEYEDKCKSDIVGSPYEFDRGKKIKDFDPLFIDASGYTDDSVMTIGFGLDLDKIDLGYNLLYIKHFN